MKKISTKKPKNPKRINHLGLAFGGEGGIRITNKINDLRQHDSKMVDSMVHYVV